MPNGWEKAKTISIIFAAVIIPIIVGWIGHTYTASIKDKEIQGRFVELSIQILSEEPTPEDRNLRKWAVDVINKYSGIKMDSTTANQVIDSVRIPEIPSNYWEQVVRNLARFGKP